MRRLLADERSDRAADRLDRPRPGGGLLAVHLASALQSFAPTLRGNRVYGDRESGDLHQSHHTGSLTGLACLRPPPYLRRLRDPEGHAKLRHPRSDEPGTEIAPDRGGSTWVDFYLVAGASAAVLIGLLFVALAINREAIAAHAHFRAKRGRRSTRSFTSSSSLSSCSSGDQADWVLGAELLCLAVSISWSLFPGKCAE